MKATQGPRRVLRCGQVNQAEAAAIKSGHPDRYYKAMVKVEEAVLVGHKAMRMLDSATAVMKGDDNGARWCDAELFDRLADMEEMFMYLGDLLAKTSHDYVSHFLNSEHYHGEKLSAATWAAGRIAGLRERILERGISSISNGDAEAAGLPDFLDCAADIIVRLEKGEKAQDLMNEWRGTLLNSTGPGWVAEWFAGLKPEAQSRFLQSIPVERWPRQARVDRWFHELANSDGSECRMIRAALQIRLEQIAAKPSTLRLVGGLADPAETGGAA